LEIEFIEVGLLVPNPLGKQVAVTCNSKAKAAWGNY
jgi:hypothetical protein